MKGATTEPCARISRVPRMSSTTTSGASQNFFRTRMKAQSSLKRSSISERLLHSIARERVRLQAIGGELRVRHPPHRVLPEESPEDPERRQDHEEHHGEDDARVDPAEHTA